MTFRVWVDQPEPRIAVIRFDSGAKPNALSHDLMRQLIKAAQSFDDDADTAAVIMTGRADIFCAGMDLSCPELSAAHGMTLAERRVLLQTGPRLCRAFESIAPMTVSAIEGWCIGGGLALSVATELRVSSENARFYLPEIERGLNMGWGSLPRINALIGPARSKRLAALAEQVDATTAEAWGLVDYIAPDGAALDRAMDVARQCAAMPPVALRMIKQGVDMAAKPLASVTSATDMDQFVLMFGSEDHAEGIASFREKRDAIFKGD